MSAFRRHTTNLINQPLICREIFGVVQLAYLGHAVTDLHG
jgi:hypothetical protein